jgi:hypothetical protein
MSYVEHTKELNDNYKKKSTTLRNFWVSSYVRTVCSKVWKHPNENVMHNFCKKI